MANAKTRSWRNQFRSSEQTHRTTADFHTSLVSEAVKPARPISRVASRHQSAFGGVSFSSGLAGTEAWFSPAAVMCEQERGTQSAVSQARVVDLVPVAPLDGAFSIGVETVSVLDERLAHLCRRARLAERQLERGVGGLHVGRVHKRVRDRC